MKKFTLIAISLLIAAPFTSFAQSRQKRQAVEELQQRLDSLQQAYDSLYMEYQLVTEAVNDPDGVILVDDELDPYLDYNSDDIDSLLNLYYIQKQMDANDLDLEVIDRDSLTSQIPDVVYIERLKRLNSFIPVQFNAPVKNAIILYTERIPKVTARILGLSTYYLPIIEDIFDEYGLPKELKALAIIESAFNPRAVSRANAKGMWQFMYGTAQMYGLEMNSYIDARYDPVESCRAAARFLRDSYRVFGDWSLAIAAYNCGSGNVSKAIRRSGGKTNFWDIYQYLPRETRGYFPAFIAALYTLKYYPEHGIIPTQVNLPAHIDTFHIDKTLHFKQISEVIGIPVETIRDLNPQYLHDIIPESDHKYILNMPHQYTLAFVDNIDSIYNYRDSLFSSETVVKEVKEVVKKAEPQRIIHKVKSGETLTSVARHYGTTVDNIKRWNGLRGNTITIGQRLYIYGKGYSGGSSSSTSTAAAAPAKSYYTVRKGDSLSSISKKSGVPLGTIYKLNGMNSKSKIYPGMKIRTK